jgi:hypothetical protein
MNMNKILFTLFCGAALLAITSSAHSHELVDINGKPVSSHTHVWRQQQYGTDYRQGHAVDNALGSITVWSPNTYQGYKAGSSVRFARPVPYSKPSNTEDNLPVLKKDSRQVYGKKQ